MLCFAGFGASALAAADLANPRTFAEAKATIAALLKENEALKQENAALKARVDALEGTAPTAKARSAEKEQFLAELGRVKGAIQQASDGEAVHRIVRNCRLTTLSAACGYPWSPLSSDKVYEPTATDIKYRPGSTRSLDIVTYIVAYRYPGSGQLFRVACFQRSGGGPNNQMAEAEWQNILDALAAWERAVQE
jgi:cell division septum initiation protein DivIVA